MEKPKENDTPPPVEYRHGRATLECVCLWARRAGTTSSGAPMTEREFTTGTIARWAKEPWSFVRECFGVEPDAWQDHALHLIAKPETQRLALKACKGPGKTTVLAWIVLWFLATRWQAKIGCTSITGSNIDTNLWPELAKWMERSQFLTAALVWTSTKVARRGYESNWFAVKRTWPKSGDAQQQKDALAGIHADHVMFVLDEAGGIPQAVMVTAEAVLLTQASEAKVVQAGNPTHTTGPLYRACTIERKYWEVITITGDPLDPNRSTRISLAEAQKQIDTYGRDNPWVMVNILGEFPPASINSLLGIEDVERAMARHYRPTDYEWAQKRLGVDVARFGDDRTVIFPRQGLASFKPVILRQADTIAIGARIARAYRDWKADLVLIDDSGHWGHGAVDSLRTAGIPCMPVIAEKPATSKRYRNLRAEMALTCADWVKRGGALPKIPELVPELTEMTYSFLGGAFVLESKDQIKKRLGGASPDIAEALFQTFALPDMPRDIVDGFNARQVTRHEFEPFRGVDLNEAPGRMLSDFDPFK